MKCQKRGFTLIELLVVIAIIAILAAILFPVFALAQERAKMTACLNDTKQIGLALNQYVEDNDGGLPANPYASAPRTRLWFHCLMPYVKSAEIFKCPSHAGLPGDYNPAKTDPERMLHTNWPVSNAAVPANPNINTWYTKEVPAVGYAYNEIVIGAINGKAMKIGNLKSPSQTALFGDGVYFYSFMCWLSPNGAINETWAGLPAHTYYWYRGGASDSYYTQPQHRGGAIFVFADGHAAWD